MPSSVALLLDLIRREQATPDSDKSDGRTAVGVTPTLPRNSIFAGIPSEAQQSGEGGASGSHQEKEVLASLGSENNVIDLEPENHDEIPGEKEKILKSPPRSPWKVVSDVVSSGFLGRFSLPDLRGEPEGADHDFEEGPYPSLGARGLKRFIVSSSRRKKEEGGTEPEVRIPTGRRRDFPHKSAKGRKGGEVPKKGEKAKYAVKLARSLAKTNWDKLSIQDQFWANSSKRSVNSKRSTAMNILEELQGINRQLPLTPGSLKAFATVLKKAGYTSGEGYLVEAKMLHVEAGHNWSHQLDRVFKQCKKALGRGKGKAKKAAEVDEEKRMNPRRTPRVRATFNGCKEAVMFGPELFNFAVNWMLREIELSAFLTSDLFFDHISKQVTLSWDTSKTDPEGVGTKRVLQCLCAGPCRWSCPYFTAFDLVKKVEKFNGAGSPLALTGRRVFDMKDISGHSARRTGALDYIRKGWSIAQVTYLGRWKSNAILGYAAEALESMPANLNNEGTNPDDQREGTELGSQRLEEWKDTLTREFDNFKKSVKEDQKLLKEAANFWENLYNSSGGNLPTKLQSLNSKVVHLNQPTPTSSPPVTWRSVCGWHYYGSHFSFVQGDLEVNCTKCLTLSANRQ